MVPLSSTRRRNVRQRREPLKRKNVVRRWEEGRLSSLYRALSARSTRIALLTRLYSAVSVHSWKIAKYVGGREENAGERKQWACVSVGMGKVGVSWATTLFSVTWTAGGGCRAGGGLFSIACLQEGKLTFGVLAERTKGLRVSFLQRRHIIYI